LLIQIFGESAILAGSVLVGAVADRRKIVETNWILFETILGYSIRGRAIRYFIAETDEWRTIMDWADIREYVRMPIGFFRIDQAIVQFDTAAMSLENGQYRLIFRINSDNIKPVVIKSVFNQDVDKPRKMLFPVAR
jgi:hypothetical protein